MEEDSLLRDRSNLQENPQSNGEPNSETFVDNSPSHILEEKPINPSHNSEFEKTESNITPGAEKQFEMQPNTNSKTETVKQNLPFYAHAHLRGRTLEELNSKINTTKEEGIYICAIPFASI